MNGRPVEWRHSQFPKGSADRIVTSRRPRPCGAAARGGHFAGRSREMTHAQRDAHVTGGVLQPPGQTRREAAAGASVMDGSGEQPRDGGEAGGRRAGGGQAPRRPAPRSRPPGWGGAISKHSGAETPGSGAASLQPPPSPRFPGSLASAPRSLPARRSGTPEKLRTPESKPPGKPGLVAGTTSWWEGRVSSRPPPARML